MTDIISLPLNDDITVPERHREVDNEKVAMLVESMREVGQINPVIVFRAEDGSGPVILVAGRHRLAAARQLGLTAIDAVFVEGDELKRELVEIDENLCRSELSPADLAVAIHRRKAIYLELHPATAHGGNQGEGGKFEPSRQSGDTVDRFTKDTADKTGMSERTIQRNDERARKVGEDNLRKIAGTSLDRAGELDALAKLDAATRDALCNRAAAGEEVSAKAALNPEPQPQPEPADHDRWRELNMDQAAAEEAAERAKAEAEAEAQAQAEAEAEASEPESEEDSDDDDYVPERTINKAELMDALKVILWCKFDSVRYGDGHLADIADPDVELHDALEEAEDILHDLRFNVRYDRSAKKALDERQRAKEAEDKARHELAKKQARGLKPAIEKRAAQLGYELVKLRGTVFHLQEVGTDFSPTVEFDRIDRWLEMRAEERRHDAQPR
jgi:ParB family chromosome partitioning protein